MLRPAPRNADPLLRAALLLWMLVAGCGCTDADSCREVKTAYMMRQIGPVEAVPDKPKAGELLGVCAHPGPSCCTSKMEDNYMAAVRMETQQKMRSYSFELKYLISGHARAFRETFESLVSFTSNMTSTLFDSAYSSLSSDCRPLVAQLFRDIALHLSGEDTSSSLEHGVHRFYNDLFPLVYRRLLNPGMGPSSLPPSSHFPSSTGHHDECLRMTRQDVAPFGPHPGLLVGGLSRALGPGRALSRLLGLAGEVVNVTERVGLSRECGQSLVRMQYCSHCRGLTLIRPCTGLCVNVMRGCLVGVSELGGPWASLVLLFQRLAATLSNGSGHHSMEPALLAVRNHVNDAILHAQLHGPRISATVEKVCGPQVAGPAMLRAHAAGSGDKGSVTPAVHQDAQVPPKRSFPLKGSRGDKPRSLKKLSREFQGSIQRYQWFFSELPEMLCENEMEVEQHTCWSGRDVVESYADREVGSGLKAQRENPEMTVRNTDPTLRGAKQRLEQLTQELLVELGWASRTRDRSAGKKEEEERGSGQRGRGSGDDCDDEDGCEGSTKENGDGESGGMSSGSSPAVKATPPRRPPTPPPRPAPPQVAVRGSAPAHRSAVTPLIPLLFLPLLLSPQEAL